MDQSQRGFEEIYIYISLSLINTHTFFLLIPILATRFAILVVDFVVVGTETIPLRGIINLEINKDKKNERKKETERERIVSFSSK